jgi:5-methylcytosine-specific restriction endonuclease McrA
LCPKANVREAVLERDDYRCRNCGCFDSKKNPLTLHHVIFRCNNGKSTVENLITWCSNCHREYHRTHVVTPKKRKLRKRRK